MVSKMLSGAKLKFFRPNFEMELVKNGLKRAYLSGFGDHCPTPRTQEVVLNYYRRLGFVAKRIHGNFFILAMSYEPIRTYLRNKRGRGRNGKQLALGHLLEYPVPMSSRHFATPVQIYALQVGRRRGYLFGVPLFYLERNRESLAKWLSAKLTAVQVLYPEAEWVNYRL